MARKKKVALTRRFLPKLVPLSIKVPQQKWHFLKGENAILEYDLEVFYYIFLYSPLAVFVMIFAASQVLMYLFAVLSGFKERTSAVLNFNGS